MESQSNSIEKMENEVAKLRSDLEQKRNFVSRAQLTAWRKRRDNLLGVLKSLKSKGYPVHV